MRLNRQQLDALSVISGYPNPIRGQIRDNSPEGLDSWRNLTASIDQPLLPDESTDPINTEGTPATEDDTDDSPDEEEGRFYQWLITCWIMLYSWYHQWAHPAEDGARYTTTEDEPGDFDHFDIGERSVIIEAAESRLECAFSGSESVIHAWLKEHALQTLTESLTIVWPIIVQYRRGRSDQHLQLAVIAYKKQRVMLPIEGKVSLEYPMQQLMSAMVLSSLTAFRVVSIESLIEMRCYHGNIIQFSQWSQGAHHKLLAEAMQRCLVSNQSRLIEQGWMNHYQSPMSSEILGEITLERSWVRLFWSMFSDDHQHQYHHWHHLQHIFEAMSAMYSIMPEDQALFQALRDTMAWLVDATQPLPEVAHFEPIIAASIPSWQQETPTATTCLSRLAHFRQRYLGCSDVRLPVLQDPCSDLATINALSANIKRMITEAAQDPHFAHSVTTFFQATLYYQQEWADLNQWVATIAREVGIDGHQYMIFVKTCGNLNTMMQSFHVYFQGHITQAQCVELVNYYQQSHPLHAEALMAAGRKIMREKIALVPHADTAAILALSDDNHQLIQQLGLVETLLSSMNHMPIGDYFRLLVDYKQQAVCWDKLFTTLAQCIEQNVLHHDLENMISFCFQYLMTQPMIDSARERMHMLLSPCLAMTFTQMMASHALPLSYLLNRHETLFLNLITDAQLCLHLQRFAGYMRQYERAQSLLQVLRTSLEKRQFSEAYQALVTFSRDYRTCASPQLRQLAEHIAAQVPRMMHQHMLLICQRHQQSCTQNDHPDYFLLKDFWQQCVLPCETYYKSLPHMEPYEQEILKMADIIEEIAGLRYVEACIHKVLQNLATDPQFPVGNLMTRSHFYFLQHGLMPSHHDILRKIHQIIDAQSTLQPTRKQLQRFMTTLALTRRQERYINDEQNIQFHRGFRG